MHIEKLKPENKLLKTKQNSTLQYIQENLVYILNILWKNI